MGDERTPFPRGPGLTLGAALLGALVGMAAPAARAAEPPGLYLQWSTVSALKDRILPAPPSIRDMREPAAPARAADEGLALSLTLDRPAASLMPAEPSGAATFRDRSTAERWYPETVFFLGVRRRF